MGKFIPYGKQSVSEEDISAVVEVLKGDWLTTGPKVPEFEKSVCEYTGVKHGVAVNSGTSALDIAVDSLNLPKESEIITTAFTFAATSNCILYNNHKPIFADILPDTYTLDPNDVKKKITDKTKAIICVDYAGHPCELDELKEIADKYNLYLIEDASHALGASYKGKKVGGIADITVFSFYPIKPITTGEGGMAVTNNSEFYERMSILRNHGIDKTPEQRTTWKYDMKLLGRNYRITDIQCALGLSQMKRLDRFVESRKKIAKIYFDLLDGLNSVKLPTIREYAKSSWHLFPILFENNKKRKIMFSLLRENSIGVNVHYIPIYNFSYYRGIDYDNLRLMITEMVSERELSIPIYVGLDDKSINKIADLIKKNM
ncbi:UDP-4-amino-4,6-dideoxy-N-acetyl-beta-L-altrosamine transaminase [Candidatus Micrarchaeota archaeon]|nr:UDP-4-amino-4,6-dideoxy-N-acetyl-beta-L-altrosamine transaminase [Candidatus Micrarchaeota archaeon]